MIRVILYCLPNLGKAAAPVWQKGLLHTFTADGHAVVEDMVTAELRLITVCPLQLKFEITADKWAAALKASQQMRA